MHSLENSFNTQVLMINERPDYKSLKPSDIIERLNTHELQEDEKKDLYGSNYRKSHALKAALNSSSEKDEENVDEDSDDPDSFGKDSPDNEMFQPFQEEESLLKEEIQEFLPSCLKLKFFWRQFLL